MSFNWVDAAGWVCDDCDQAFQSVPEAETHEAACTGAYTFANQERRA